jgi:hypothetical protein
MIVGFVVTMFGSFSRTYTIASMGSCFFVDGVKWGPFCFAQGSLMPELVTWGASIAGLAMILWGNILMRRARQAANPK